MDDTTKPTDPQTMKVIDRFKVGIGPQHIVLETAAFDLARDLVGTDRLQIETWHVMFLSRGKTGPFRVDGEAIRGADGKVGVRMIIVDEGEGRDVTSGSCVFRIVS